MACYACARALEIAPTGLPRTPIVALDVLSAMAFAMVDGARRYGVRGIAAFTLICIVVGNVVENVGVATGFPFGRYYFVELMGPKLLHVPVLLGLAYIGMAYVSWRVAEAIAGPSLTGTNLAGRALLAATIMTAWDVAQDPVWSTVLHGWVWRDGGAWFGVPVSNYLGWLGTEFTLFLVFALYLRRTRLKTNAGAIPGPQAAIAFYALCALGNVLQLLPAQNPAIVYDPTGRAWSARTIVAASAMVSLFAMGGFAGVAWWRTAQRARGLQAE